MTLRDGTDPDIGVCAPVAIARPVMRHRWSSVSFLHAPVEAGVIAALLPDGVEPDVFDGSAWAGLIPFDLAVRVPAWAPSVPWLARTHEVNARTYVRGPDGRRGIWFFSLDAARLAAVGVARVWYRIPYRWARMSTLVTESVASYRSVRRTGGGIQARFAADLALGPVLERCEMTPLERFLICRWRLYAPGRSGVTVARIEHDPWPLRRARVVHLEESLLAAAGIPNRTGEMLAHFSSGVDVAWDRRRPAATAGTRAQLTSMVSTPPSSVRRDPPGATDTSTPPATARVVT